MNRIHLLKALIVILCLVQSGFSAETPATKSLDEATELFRSGKKAEAFALVQKIITADSKNAKAFFIQGSFYMEDRQPGKAVDSFNKAIAFDPTPAPVYQTHGEANFQPGRFQDSVKDFTKVLEIEPEKAPYHWQRGISCYYA